ncbi:phage holin, lambda family [Lonepinella koalarum]|uniref:phage holin, lambda family n=1 Tax=Lonepinella koalarum TaxID=53417 RepID=UPI003F6E1400
MADKEYTVVELVLNYSKEHINAIYSFFMAFIMAYLRIYYIGKDHPWLKRYVEAVICGLIAVASESVFEYFNMPTKLSVAFGAGVAFLGVDQIRIIAKHYAQQIHKKYK